MNKKRSTYIFFSWMAASAWPRSPTHEANARKIHAVWKRRKQQISTASLGTQSKEEVALINMLHPPMTNAVVRVLRQTSKHFPPGSVFHQLDHGWQPVICLPLFGSVLATCGLSSTVWIRNGNLWSVFNCFEQEWQTVVCLQLFGPGMATCGLSSTVWTKDGNLWSVFNCLDQEWQPVVRLQLFGSGMATCGLSSTVWIRNGNLWSVFPGLEQGW